MSADDFKAFFRPFHLFFGVLQGVFDIENLIVDLIHVVGEGAYIGVKIKIGVAIFSLCFIVKLL